LQRRGPGKELFERPARHASPCLAHSHSPIPSADMPSNGSSSGARADHRP
jgi:hypothetical protein